MTRVAITTDRFEQVAPCYVDAGLEPVSLPCIQTQPEQSGRIAYARERASGAGMLIVSSPRVVSMLWPAGQMPPIDTAVVGQSTKARVEAAGGRVLTVGDGGLSRLVDLIGDSVAGRHVVIARAAGSDPAAMDRLRELVPDLEEHVIYRTVPVPPPAEPVEAVAFASPSAVEGWLSSRDLEDLVVGSIGSTTANVIRRIREPDVIATRPSHELLAAAIASVMEVKV